MSPQWWSFTTGFNGLKNVLTNEVGVTSAVDPRKVQNRPSPRQYTAIWDTGAMATVITDRIVQECGLKPISVCQVTGVHGSARKGVYLVDLFLPNKVIIGSLRVIGGGQIGDADVLIGMDVISKGDFAVTNKDGETHFSFRFPSLECIDFTKQKPPESHGQVVNPLQKVGRNELCPCGSGKKYKQCCMRKV